MREIGLPNINLLDGVSFVNNFDPFSPQRYAVWMEMLDDLPEEEISGWLALMNVSIHQKMNPEVPRGVNYLSVDPRARFELVSCVNQVQTGEAAWRKIKEMVSGKEDYCTVIETEGEIEQFDINKSTSQSYHREQSGGYFCDAKRGTLFLFEQTGMVQLESAVEGYNCLFDQTQIQDGEIAVIEEVPGRVKLFVSSENGGWLVMRDTWYPGWIAQVDGERIDIYKARFSFQGCPCATRRTPH